MPSVEAVCFDLDDTLCVSKWSDHEFNSEIFKRTDTDPIFSPSDLRSVNPKDIESAENVAEFYTNLYRATVRNIDTDVDPNSPLIEKLGKLAGDLYEPTAVTFRKGAEETLKYVRKHYTVGLITNGKRETQTTKLKKLGIIDTFDTAVICDPNWGIDSKPAQEPFEMALADLSTSTENTLHIGDSHGEDVLGAHNAGFQSVWAPINRSHEELPSEPDPAPTYRVKSLTDLLTII
jgi:putative hydrolase of the HAD superfamily